MTTIIMVSILALFGVGIIAAIVFIILKRNKDNYEIVDSETEENLVIDEPKKKVKKKIKKNEELENSILPNYNAYKMSINEKITWSLLAMAFLFGIGFIFYRSVIISLIFSLVGLFYPKLKKKDIIHERKNKLLLQFKEALYALSSSLGAGKSVPIAFKDTYSDLKLLFDDNKDKFILNELQYIIRRIDRNETIEEALEDFARRSSLEDIETFADIFTSCTRTGGNLKEIIKNSSEMIGDKIEIKQEIEILVSGKKFEGKILSFVPIGLVLFLQLTAPEFMDPIFTGVGRVVSTIALILIGIGNMWSNKIMKIEV